MKKIKINNFFRQNSPTILTVIGSIGVGITAVMSARDTVKAIKRINYQRGYQMKEFNTKEKIKLAAPCYIPTALSAVSTILCICGANKLNKNMQKSLTSAYILLDQSYKEYKKSVKEVYGKEGEEEIARHTAERKAEESQLTEPEIPGDIFFDNFSLQFFTSTLEKVRDAEKQANEILRTQGYISLRTMYSLLGENVIGTDNLLGWSIGAGKVYDYEKMELEVTVMPREDGRVKYIVDFVSTPTEDYLYWA